MAFRIDCRMLDCPGDMRRRYEGRMWCEACAPWRLYSEEVAPVAMQEHLMECPAFSYLRPGRDIQYNKNDLTRYFMDVMRVRTLGK